MTLGTLLLDKDGGNSLLALLMDIIEEGLKNSAPELKNYQISRTIKKFI